MTKLKLSLLLTFGLFVAGCQMSSRRIESVAPYVQELDQRSEAEIIENRLVDGTELSFLLFDLEKGQKAANRNARLGLIPASTSKVVSMWSVLRILEPKERFSTLLAYRGKIKGGVLHGDLYLKGSGDPTLRSAHLVDMALKLKQAGVKKVSGRFFYDDSSFVSEAVLNSRQNVDGVYNSGIGPLNVNLNRFTASWVPGEDGSVQISEMPSSSLVRFGLSEKLPERFANFKFKRSGREEHWLLSYDSPKQGSERLPVKDSGLYTAQLLKLFAKRIGVSIPKPSRKKLHSHSKILLRHESSKLVDLVDYTLDYSDNLASELLVVRAMRKIDPKIKRIASIRTKLNQWAKSQLGREKRSGLFLENASGLSVKSRLSADQLVWFLRDAYKRRFEDRSFMSLLPLGGARGTLRKRFNRPGRAFRVWAKTGTMKFVSGLTGYLMARSGKIFAFAILMNHKKLRAQLDSEWGDESARAFEFSGSWLVRARRVQDELVGAWIDQN